MARKKAAETADGAQPASGSALDLALDALYAAPFEGFVAARREAALRLRAAGEVAAARFIATAAKPTRTAWALNQVARHQPALVAAVVASREAAAAAQKSGNAQGIREGARRFRDAVGDVVRASRTVLDEAKAPLNAAQARRMAETLQALATDDAERQKLAAGRLTQDVLVDDPFAGMEPGPAVHREREAPTAAAHGAHPAPSAKQAPVERHASHAVDAGAAKAARAKEDAERRRDAAERAEREKKRAIDEARAELSALDRSAETARDAAAVAEQALARAREETDVARRALSKAEDELARARARAKKLGA